MSGTIAIVGRPNVGKSTLFNRFLGERKALVNDRPGVTRDRNYGESIQYGRTLTFIDTGGFEPVPDDLLFESVRVQAEEAIKEADLLLFVVDREAGITPADLMTAEILRKLLPSESNDKLLLVVNKCDGPNHELDAAEFWELGFPEMICISAEHGRGYYDLIDLIFERLPEEITSEDEDLDDDEIRIAILGKPNIGKSTLVNHLIGENRHVVHDMPGTTMDSIDSMMVIGDQKFRLVDTAGIRRRSKIGDKLEGYAVSRAIKAIERCHLTLLMIDGVEGVSHQDARLASLIQDRGRACIILMNRWDLVKKHPERNSKTVVVELQKSLPHLSWAPVLFISALTGKGCHRIIDQVNQVYKEFDTRVNTSRLNQFLEDVVSLHPPPQKNHHRVRLNYVTQTRVRPPTFIVWSNSPESIQAPYKRYLENRLRESFGFFGSPIRIHFRKKRRQWEEK